MLVACDCCSTVSITLINCSQNSVSGIFTELFVNVVWTLFIFSSDSFLYHLDSPLCTRKIFNSNVIKVGEVPSRVVVLLSPSSDDYNFKDYKTVIFNGLDLVSYFFFFRFLFYLSRSPCLGVPVHPDIVFWITSTVSESPLLPLPPRFFISSFTNSFSRF